MAFPAPNHLRQFFIQVAGPIGIQSTLEPQLQVPFSFKGLNVHQLSLTSSALFSNEAGTVSPHAAAFFKLTTISVRLNLTILV